MKPNVCLISSLRKPFRSLLLLILFGLISFGFITKAVGFILVQRETEVLGSYYRSIGVLDNVNDPQSGDVSAGIELIKTSPYFAYGDQRRLVSGVLQQTYNSYGRFYWSNSTEFLGQIPKEHWFNVHNTDRWFIGELIKKEEVKDDKRKQPEDKITIGYYLEFRIDTLLAAYPEDARQGQSLGLLFMFEGNEAAVPLIEEIEVGQRYLIRGWKDVGFPLDFDWENTNYADLELLPLDDQGLWYIRLASEASIDFSDPDMASIKNDIDILNENLHALGIITTADMSAMPIFQEASREYYLVEGRWLNHQDDLAGNKVIVVPNDFAAMRGFKLGDELMLTFRPLKDTFIGLIRDGVDTFAWRSYPTYQEPFKIVGLYEGTTKPPAILAYIPASSLRPGFASSTKYPYREEGDYSFVLDSPRNETKFIQEYKVPLQALGINLTFLANNGPAYWAAVDPIRRSSSADILIFGLLMVVALIMAVFIYLMQRKRDYAILRALGVPVKQANGQLILPLLLLGGLGIIIGGLPSWNYALSKAKASISTIPTPAGVYPSADLSPFFLAGLCVAIFLLLALFSWLGVFLLAHKPVFEILQGETFRSKGGQKGTRNNALSKPIHSLYSSLAGTVNHEGSGLQEPPANKANLAAQRKYHPSSLSQYVIHHLVRSKTKSFLTLAIALGFMLASGWIRQTMERSLIEVDRLYDTTVVEADILLADPTRLSTEETPTKGSGFVYQKTIDSVLNSGFVKSSALEADITWPEISKLDTLETFAVFIPVYAYDSPDAFYSGVADPGSLSFATGWDMERFAGPRTLEEIRKDGVPAIFPAILLEQLQLEVGEKVQITDPFINDFPCFIVGQYTGGRSLAIHGGKIPWFYSPSDSILISLSAMKSIERSQIKYTVAHFVLDPTKNRELAQFRADMEKVMQGSGAGTGDLRFMIWDEELKVVVSQLDKNITLLKVLYPVVIAVSVLIGAGLCFLLLLQATREAAIMRVLGTTRTAVQLALIIEPLILSIGGVIIGLVISRLLWTASGLVPTVPLLSGAGLYLAGVLVGLVIGTISVTNKKPIELLQVKE